MAKNNFQLYQEQMESRFAESADSIRKNVQSRKDLWTFVGDIIDLYIPKIMSTLMGGVSMKYNSKIEKPEDRKDS